MLSKPLSCKLSGSEIIVNGDLRISFRRTIRVPDNHQVSYLPPDLGAYPLKAVADYGEKMPSDMTIKGGVFFPMYQSEAMWINFECGGSQDYMIKIYVGCINAISGEPAVEDAGTELRRQARLAKDKGENSGASSLQDYIVVPGQKWLDGIADSNGTIRQFVAMPFGSGHSVESQITGKDAAGGIQFEITPYEPRPAPSLHKHVSGSVLKPSVADPSCTQGIYTIWVNSLTGKRIKVCVEGTDTIELIKRRIQDKEGIPPDQQKLVFMGAQMQDDLALAYFNVSQDSTIHLILKLRGGGFCPARQMAIAAGGKIKQSIVRDQLGEAWQSQRTTVFNVQILNSAVYKEVTGEDPPTKPLDVETYKEHGLPFYDMYEGPSGVSGDFSMVKSVAQMDKKKEDVVTPDVVEIKTTPTIQQPVGLTNRPVLFANSALLAT